MLSPETAQWAQKLDQYVEPETIERAIADSALGLAENHPRKQVVLLEKSLYLSRRLEDDPEAFYWTACNWLYCINTPQHSKGRYDLAEELFSKVHEAMNFTYRKYILTVISNLYLEVGDIERWKEISTLTHELAEKTNQPNEVIRSLTSKVIQATMDGKLEGAVDLSRKIIQIGHDSEFALSARTAFTSCGLRPRLYLGRVSEMVNDKSADTNENPWQKAWFLSLLGRKDEAYEILNRSIRNRLNIPVNEDLLWSTWDINFLEAAVMCGHIKMTERVLSRFKNDDKKTTGIYYTTIIP